MAQHLVGRLDFVPITEPEKNAAEPAPAPGRSLISRKAGFTGGM
jgi:hypothetical protein